MNDLSYDRDLWRIPGIHLVPNANLATRTSMKTRARCAMLAEVHEPEALYHLTRLCRRKGYPFLMLGEGSNTIFATSYFNGVVVFLNTQAFKRMEVIGPNLIRIGAGERLIGLMNYANKSGLMGLEFCTMIPGTVGGALAGNAGTDGWGICDFVDRATIMTRDGEIHDVFRNEFRYTYRHSELSQAIILEADIRLEPLDPEEANRRKKMYRDKKKIQPYGKPNAGCIFKNPKDPNTGKPVSAGMLIDRAGLKNYDINGSIISDGHANFIINQGQASGEDFQALITLIQDIIYDREGIELELEVNIIGGHLTTLKL